MISTSTTITMLRVSLRPRASLPLSRLVAIPHHHPHLPASLPLRPSSLSWASHRSFSTPSPIVPAPTPKSPHPHPNPSSHLLPRSTRHQLHLLRLELLLLRSRLPPPSRRSLRFLTLLALVSSLFLAYNFSTPFRRAVLACKRCALVGWAVARCMVDYKVLFGKTWSEDEEGQGRRHEDYERCHTVCAERIRDVLKRNGGIYIKLGQHLSSIALIPPAWSLTMKPLQDQCSPTPLSELQALFLSDVGAPMSFFFSSFDEVPIGVASLAQVHLATDRESGRRVAVKVMHPTLEEFCDIDMKTTTLLLKVVKSVFPTFEFTWLGEEMEQNLPLEMDFRHEAANALRCASDFSSLKRTTLVIPEVLWAKKRAMVMEYIEGSRIDDLQYLAQHNIDRNKVAQQLSHIFSRMIYITGFFHADPHGGNLLIRPSQPNSRSPYNFEIVLLDHGLYFDMSTSLRVNYSHLWLSLISPSSPAIEAARRKYANLAGNIDEELYPIFQAAITGRVALETVGEGNGSMLDFGKQSNEERKRLQGAIGREGMVGSIFELLRRVPRRMLMVLKVNDLTRALDASLHTTHPPSRIFLIVAQYCNLSIYISDHALLRTLYTAHGLSIKLVVEWVKTWGRFQGWNWSLRVVEMGMDTGAWARKRRDWWRGWWRGGVERARREEAGLVGA